jgi:hypothetical protein
MYEHIKESAQKEGRYGKRAKRSRRKDSDEDAQRKGHKKGR